MTDVSQDAAQSASNYTPPMQVASNSNIEAVVAQAVAKALADQASAAAQANAPVAQSPEEQAKSELDNAGAGLGIEERLAQLYRHVQLLASKVGL